MLFSVLRDEEYDDADTEYYDETEGRNFDFFQLENVKNIFL